MQRNALHALTNCRKVINCPCCTIDKTVLTKLDKIQDQLTKLQSQMNVEIEIENKPPNKSSSASLTNATSADYTESTKIIDTTRPRKQLIDLGFTYDSNTSELTCVYMSPKLRFNEYELNRANRWRIYVYPYDLDQNFDDHENLPRAFIYLKKSIKRHLIDSTSHQKNVRAEEERKSKQRLHETKNEHAGMNLGRLCIKH